jgi:UDP-glucose 4-epimerase
MRLAENVLSFIDMRILLTGSAGCLASVLLPRLCEQPWLQRCVGVDLNATSFDHPKFVAIQGDMRFLPLDDLLANCDAVVHLAFAVTRGALTPSQMRDNNVDGSLRVLMAAHQAGIDRIVNLSSVSVYGSGEDLSEESPLNPAPNYPYACHKADIEERTSQLKNIVHLRSHLIFGSHCQPFLRQALRHRAYIAPPPPIPVMQVVHEWDVASAVMLALRAPAAGPYNLAASQIITLPELVRNGRKFLLPIPLSVARGVAAGIRRFTPGDMDLTWLDIMDTTLTVQCSRAQTLLGWAPRYSAWDARRAM